VAALRQEGTSVWALLRALLPLSRAPREQLRYGAVATAARLVEAEIALRRAERRQATAAAEPAAAATTVAGGSTEIGADIPDALGPPPSAPAPSPPPASHVTRPSSPLSPSLHFLALARAHLPYIAQAAAPARRHADAGGWRHLPTAEEERKALAAAAVEVGAAYGYLLPRTCDPHIAVRRQTAACLSALPFRARAPFRTRTL